MENSLVAINNSLLAQASTYGRNYIITSPLTGEKVKLEREIDFGVIPNTKRPTLYKSGAEKVVGAYQLMTRYDIVSSMENHDAKTAFFMYTIKCSLVKGFIDGNGNYNETVYATGFGSANTAEKRNGYNDACNSANSTLKMAQKRALTSAALAISGLSSMFTMDIEDETISKKANDIISESPESPLTKAQQTRLFAVAGDNGLTKEECKQKLASLGFAKSSDIKQKDYNMVIEELKKIDIKENK